MTAEEEEEEEEEETPSSAPAPPPPPPAPYTKTSSAFGVGLARWPCAARASIAALSSPMAAASRERVASAWRSSISLTALIFSALLSLLNLAFSSRASCAAWHAAFRSALESCVLSPVMRCSFEARAFRGQLDDHEASRGVADEVFAGAQAVWALRRAELGELLVQELHSHGFSAVRSLFPAAVITATRWSRFDRLTDAGSRGWSPEASPESFSVAAVAARARVMRDMAVR